MDETMKAVAKQMKCFDLAGQLGKVLGVNPVWKDKYVIYRIGLDDAYIKLCFDLDNGRWLIFFQENARTFTTAEFSKKGYF